jgi:hypothetical protein
MLRHIGDWLPCKGDVMDVDGVQFEFTDFGIGNFALAALVFAHQGQNAARNCLDDLLSYGANHHGEHIITLIPVGSRSTEHIILVRESGSTLPARG